MKTDSLLMGNGKQAWYARCWLCKDTGPGEFGFPAAEIQARARGWGQFKIGICKIYTLCPACQQGIVNLGTEITDRTGLKADHCRTSAQDPERGSEG